MVDQDERFVEEDPFFTEIRARLPGYRFKLIFDVGANIGQCCVPFSILAPESRIYAFEPVAAAYEELEKNVANHPSITPVNLAFGNMDGTVLMQNKGSKTSNRVLLEGGSGLDVPITTGRKFCEQHGISEISFLKIDTEGFDMEVLLGFGDLLKNVDFVQVEAAMNPTNTRHVQFFDFVRYLEERGFYLFQIYDQTFEFHEGGRPWLRRCNPAFVSYTLLDRMPPNSYRKLKPVPRRSVFDT